MQHLNGNMENYGQIQFVNETESTLAGHPDYASGLKRTAGDAGFDSDPEMGGHNEMYEAGDGVGSPSGASGKKTRGRVKIAMRFIENKLRRYTTFSKRKTGIMKKAYELSTLTGTQVMLLVASETGHVYTFATRKLQPMITSESGKALIQTCLNSPDMASLGGSNSNNELDQSELSEQAEDERMNPGGFEETGLNYQIEDDQPKTMVPSGGLNISPSPSPNAVTEADNHNSSPPPPLTTAAQTIAFSSYLSPPQSLNGEGGGKLTNMTMQLPAGGLAAFIPQQQGVTTASTPQATVTIASTSPSMSAVAPAQPTFATMVSAAGTPGATPVMYQTPQGMVYAGLPEGYVLNLPQTTLSSATHTQQGGGTAVASMAGQQQQQPQYITIPVPVSLATGQVFQPFLAQAQQQVQQQMQQVQQVQQQHAASKSPK